MLPRTAWRLFSLDSRLIHPPLSHSFAAHCLCIHLKHQIRFFIKMQSLLKMLSLAICAKVTSEERRAKNLIRLLVLRRGIPEAFFDPVYSQNESSFDSRNPANQVSWLGQARGNSHLPSSDIVPKVPDEEQVSFLGSFRVVVRRHLVRSL